MNKTPDQVWDDAETLKLSYYEKNHVSCSLRHGDGGGCRCFRSDEDKSA